jgi:hypothetical protein
MAASTPHPLVGFARAIGMLLLIPVGLALALVLIVAGYEALYFFQGRPADIASMAAKANVDLADSAGSLDRMTAALGPPADKVGSTLAQNATSYWWWRDSAVQATVVGDTPVFIDIGSHGGFHLLPYKRPDFPGSFLGLRIGDATPSPARAASLKARTADCCSDGELTWDVRDGRVSAIHYARPHSYMFGGR